ncbi:MAG TPA: GNAT family N-acetyltransferase [Candidatus Limnocylindrales bacterium]|nr:GNAT family N-acetyltransferase [Candidatus Limnocylindrales bacterium]
MAQAARVLQVNVSRGGVPKLPVEQAWVSRYGVEGDGHHDRTLHGGPHRAVCLFSIEAIDRIRSEGHPIEPGSTGENLTTVGIEWATLPLGTRARIGQQLVIELADSATPCATIRRSFSGGRFSRMSIERHPSDSRMYARVVEEGSVSPGDQIELLPEPRLVEAEHERLLSDLDQAVAKASLVAWRAAGAAGLDVRVKEDGDLAMVASPQLPGPAFNHATGFARLPNLGRDATDFFDRHRCPGWIEGDEPPWPGAEPVLELAVMAALPTEIGRAETPPGVSIRVVTPERAAAAAQLMVAAGSSGTDTARAAVDAWRAALAAVADHAHGTVLLAEEDGRPVGTAVLFGHHSAGWLRAAVVDPLARGRGIHAALTSERARLAAERGWRLVGSAVQPEGAAARNMLRLGFQRIGTRRHYLYKPRADRPAA